MSNPTLSLFGRLPELEPVTGPCVGCQRKPARTNWVTVDPVAVGGAVSNVGLCDGCAAIVDRFTVARDQRHAVARRAAEVSR